LTIDVRIAHKCLLFRLVQGEAAFSGGPGVHPAVSYLDLFSLTLEGLLTEVEVALRRRGAEDAFAEDGEVVARLD
jgi:hypothetical protein